MANEKVLVVDDEQGIREDLHEFLSGQGYQVGLAEDGNKGVKEFEQTNYDLVFMDIKMPGIDGIEAMRQMKKSKPESKIVIITGIPDEETFERAASVVDGTIEGFIAKPFKPNDIKAVLEKVLTGEKLPSFSLTQAQENCLTEIGKSGADNASQALAQILKKEIKIDLQKVRSFSLKKLLKSLPRPSEKGEGKPMSPAEEAGPPEAIMIGAVMHVQGEIRGRMAVLLSYQNGLDIADLRAGQTMGGTKAFSEAGINTVKSVAAVLSKSYLTAVSKLLGVSITSLLPTVFFDNEDAILKLVAEDFPDEYIFTIETELAVTGTEIKSRILLVPDTNSLKLILKNMGMFKS